MTKKKNRADWEKVGRFKIYEGAIEDLKGKICTKCGEYKEIKFFSKKGSHSTGHTSECKPCAKIRNAKYTTANLETIKAKKKERWGIDGAVSRKKTKKKNPLVYLLSNARNNAKKYGRDFNIDLELLQKLWEDQKGLCYYSGQPMLLTVGSEDKNAVSLDRRDNSKGYIPDNVVLCRWIVNNVKRDRPYEEFINNVDKLLRRHE